MNPDRAHRARLSAKRKIIDTATITSKQPVKQLEKFLTSPRLEVRRTAAMSLSRTKAGRKTLTRALGHKSARTAVEALYALASVPYQVEVTGVFHDLKMAGPYHTIRSHIVRSVNKRLFVSDTPQLPFYSYNTEFGLFGGITISSVLVIDVLEKYSRKTTGQHYQLNAETIAAILRTTSPWLSPQILLIDLDDKEGDVESQIIVNSLRGTDPFIFGAIVNGMAGGLDPFPESTARFIAQLEYPRVRLAYLLSSRLRNPREQAPLRWGLKDADPQVRRAAVQWVAEEHLIGYRPQVKAMLNDRSRKMSSKLFLSTLAALEMLDGVPPKKFDTTPASKYVLPLLTDAKRPPAVRAQALRLVDPSDPAITAKLYRNLLATKDAPLIRETVRTLDHSPLKSAAELLMPIAMNKQNNVNLRADAITGLTGRWFDADNAAQVRKTLEQLMLSKQRPLQLEAVRAGRTLLTKTAHGRVIRLKLLRQLAAAQQADPKILADGGTDRPLAEQLVLALTRSRIALPDILKPVQADRPKTDNGWFARVTPPGGDAAAGRRIFFHSQGPGCYKCHTVDGRGGQIGPNLSVVARAMNRQKLAESILTPSKEISPQFTTWAFLMESGKVLTGMILGDTRNNIQRIGTTEGKIISLPADKIEERTPQNISLMPRKLVDQMTVSELRDLLAFLETLK